MHPLQHVFVQDKVSKNYINKNECPYEFSFTSLLNHVMFPTEVRKSLKQVIFDDFTVYLKKRETKMTGNRKQIVTPPVKVVKRRLFYIETLLFLTSMSNGLLQIRKRD